MWCRKDTFYNPLLIIYTPLKRPMAPPSVFYFCNTQSVVYLFPIFLQKATSKKRTPHISHTRPSDLSIQLAKYVITKDSLMFLYYIISTSIFKNTFSFLLRSPPGICNQFYYYAYTQKRNKNRCKNTDDSSDHCNNQYNNSHNCQYEQ